MLTTVIFEMAESSCITGLDIGNYRSCVVNVEASTASEPDNWQPIVQHQFMTNDEAANNQFRDQVQIFTKKELNPDQLKTKFDRIKVTCMQSANKRELFGLAFISFKTEVVVDLNIDIFGRFKMKEDSEDSSSDFDSFKEKGSKIFSFEKKNNFKDEIKAKAKEDSLEKFTKRQDEQRAPPKRPMLQKLEEGKADEVFRSKEKVENKLDKVENQVENKVNKVDSPKNVKYTPFGDVLASTSTKKEGKNLNGKHSLDSEDTKATKKMKCKDCECTKDKLCKDCGLLYAEKEKPTKNEVKKKKKKQTKEFGKLFEGISFSLSGYVNPQRDSIRRKALEMGAKYIADPNANRIFTHLICAFKNTPKSQQLKGRCKIVNHKFIEDCFEKKIR